MPQLALDPRRVYIGMSFALGILFQMLFPIAAVYRVVQGGVNPLQLVLVGTALEVSAFVSEVPSGVLADSYSRRLSVVLGIALMGCGIIIEGAVATFWVFVVAQLFWGVGFSFVSGAREAWLADEIGEEAAAPVYVRAAQLRQVGGLLGIPIGVALATISLRLPFLVSGPLMLLLAVVLYRVMTEQGFTPARAEDRASWRGLAATARAGLGVVGKRPVLAAILIAAVAYGASSEAFDRLWEVHFLTNFELPPIGGLDPVVWFGIFTAGAMLLSVGGMEVVQRRVDLAGERAPVALLVALGTAIVGGLVVFGLTGSFAVAVLAYWCVAVARRMHEPIFIAWLNRGLDSGSRATVLSLAGQTDALGQMAGGPVLGVVATVRSLRVAMVTTAALLLPAVAIYMRAAIRGERSSGGLEPAPAATED